jgi:hypothetical protein
MSGVGIPGFVSGGNGGAVGCVGRVMGVWDLFFCCLSWTGVCFSGCFFLLVVFVAGCFYLLLFCWAGTLVSSLVYSIALLVPILIKFVLFKKKKVNRSLPPAK